MKKGQGSFEYIIILAVIILIALVIVSALSGIGIFQFRNSVEENANEINNLIQDVGIEYAVKKDGYTQVGLRSVVNSKVIIYNFTIGGCLFDLNGTELFQSWRTYAQNCSGISGRAGDSYDFNCILGYMDSIGIHHRDAGRCYGFYED